MAHVRRATIGFPSRHAARALVLQTKMATSGHWIIFALVMVLGFSAALLLYRLDKNSLVYFGDSASHLVGARKLADWGEDPGLARFGTVWLPVPHLLLLPFTLAGSLFSTGFAGVAVSLPSVALTAVLLYKIIKNHLAGPAYLAGAGALLYALNPNILYLGLIRDDRGPVHALLRRLRLLPAEVVPRARRPAELDVVIDVRGAGHAVQVRRLDPSVPPRPGGLPVGRTGRPGPTS